VTVYYQRGYLGYPTSEYNKVVGRIDLSESRSAEQLIADAVQVARDADYVIFFGGLNKSDFQDCEGVDRKELALPYEQDKVVDAIAAVNPNIVFVNISGNAVEMPWLDKVPGVIQGWYIGSEAGNALADVIFGKVNPSGKLPMTFPMSLESVGAHAYGPTGYPGVLNPDNSNQIDMTYNEGILVGYRWNDTKKIKPLFPFGYGLSYTTFEYGKMTADNREIDNPADKITFTVPVTNTGNREGSEIVQLYISDPKCSVLRPVKELKRFAKVKLAPGETKDVTFTISVNDLTYFDDIKHEWVAEAGDFVAHVAASSADIKSSVKFKLKDGVELVEIQ
ncbi:MAG: glycoside hydrolase family 3 C-terminal domain-containing protein, partial [Muribaculaceae bacterium]|nr:glycoside hydrolase family 3 C-terminal domain-containing protein [Muribaculaceae bacterium]